MELAKIIVQYIEVLIWPLIVLIVLILFRAQIAGMFSRMRKADLPGGISIETFPEEIKEAKAISAEVKEEKPPSESIQSRRAIPLTEANARMLNLGLAPSPSGLELSYYRVLADQDPALALAGLRIEVETMLKNLAKGFEVPIGERDSASIITRKLREKSAITIRQADLVSAVIKLCNAAVHGLKVTASQAEEILDIAAVLRDQYIAWLSWGFPDDWKPTGDT